MHFAMQLLMQGGVPSGVIVYDLYKVVREQTQMITMLQHCLLDALEQANLLIPLLSLVLRTRRAMHLGG